MKTINFNSMVKGIFRIVISGVFLLFFPLIAHGIDIPCLSTQYSLTISVTPIEGGAVSPKGTNCYDSGQVVSLTATPNPGYFFSSWFGDLSGTDNPTSITMNGSKNIEANFVFLSGGLDTTFNSPNGFVTYFAGAHAVALQADGKIIVVGETSSSGVALVLRYNSDGILDITFGVDGVVTYGTLSALAGYAVALQTDGKIVVVGNSSTDLLVLRYNSNGTLDTTFGLNGVSIHHNAASYGVAVQEDGKIVIVGNSSTDLLVLRYKDEGTLDTTFGVNGVFTFANTAGYGVALQRDGKTVVVGKSSDGSNEVLLLLRLNDDGTLDNDFGMNGAVTYGTPNTVGNALAIQEDGRIIAAGQIGCDIGGMRPLLVRYKSDGMLDTVLRNNGFFSAYNAVALQGDGKIVAVGTTDVFCDGMDRPSAIVEVYNDDGSEDNTYQNRRFDLPYPSYREGKSVVIQSDGKVIIVENEVGFGGGDAGKLFVSRHIVKPEQQEAVSIPNKPNGPITGTIMSRYAFLVSGSSSNQGHPVEYRTDWDDGTYSNWLSTGTFSKNWNSPGNYNVRAQARCALHNEIWSLFSEPLLVNISVTEIISAPNILYGPTSGIAGNSYPYLTGGSISNFGHSLQYLFDWGDSTNSGWLPAGTTSVSHSWTASGPYLVKVQARCATDTNVISSWSGSLTVNIASTTQSYIVTANPLGLQIIVDGTTYTGLQTFNWTPGSSHTLSVSSPQSGTAGTRYVFSFWSDGGAQTHTITAPSSNTTYTATFSTQYQLTITSSPPAGGTAMPSPMGDQSGIACIALVGVVCAGYYSSGTLVTLTATPNTGYTFSGWSGDLSGAGNPTSVTMNGAKNVVANFTQDQYTLTVSINPTGAGSVTKVPDKTTYIYGDVVELTATAAIGYSFSNWSGNASGTTNPVTLTIDNNKTVTANFTELIGPDLTGSWTTPVTQTCKSTKKGPKCTIKGVLTINNNGNRDASFSTVKFYLSDSNTYDQGDTPLKSAATGKIKAKKSKSIRLSKSFPLGQIVTDKYVIAAIDIYNSVKEIDETNNIIVFGPIQ